MVFAVAVILFFYKVRKEPNIFYRIGSEGACFQPGWAQKWEETAYNKPNAPCLAETQDLSAFQKDAWLKAGLPATARRDYRLHFIEMSDDNKTFGPGQIEALEAALSRDGQKVVIIYVHGWRNNASWGNNDVRRFRIVLTYFRSFLNVRCIETNRYCDSDLIGVFAGWRGASLQEGPQEETAGGLKPPRIGHLLAAPTLFGRKAQSESLAETLLAELIDRMESKLELDRENIFADRLLLTGHSLGGNMLITHLGKRAESALVVYKRDRKPGMTLSPISGDLAVIFNPASEAWKWNNIQRKERQMAGFTLDDQNPLSFRRGDSHEKAAVAWRHLYPETQRPVLVSFTATKGWPGNEDSADGAMFDAATGVAFKFYALARLQLNRESRTTIGHFLPTYKPEKHPDKMGRELKADTPALGLTHDFVINKSLYEPSIIKAALAPDSSWCASGDGALLQARETMNRKNGGFSLNWNWTKKVGSPRKNVEIQFRQQLALKQGKGKFYGGSIAPPTTPFWNVRTPGTTLQQHGGYWSYPLWCGIARLWLDPITSRLPASK